MGFVADSIGATIGAAAAFLLGRTVSSSIPERDILLVQLEMYSLEVLLRTA